MPRRGLPMFIGLCLLACAGCAGSSTPDTGAGSRPPSPSVAASLPPVQTLEAVGARAVPAAAHLDWILAVDGAIWVTSEREVLRFDAAGHRTASAPAPRICAAMDAHAGSLWVASCTDNAPSVRRIDSTTGRPLATIPMPEGGPANESSIAATDDGIWVVGANSPRMLVVIDPATNKPTRTVPVPLGVSAVRAGFGSIWAASTTDNELLRLDPATGRAQATISIGQGPRFMTVGFDSVWVLNQRDGSVSRVDPATNRVRATISVSGPVFGGDLAVGPDALWVHPTDALAVRIDPATDTVTERIGTITESGGIAATQGALWLTEHRTDTLWRIAR